MHTAQLLGDLEYRFLKQVVGPAGNKPETGIATDYSKPFC